MGEAEVGRCVEHPDRGGVPCSRCGTFRCEQCLEDGRCPPCRASEGFHRPLGSEAVGFQRRFWGRLLDTGLDQVSALAGGLLAGIALAVLEALGRTPPGWAERVSQAGAGNYLGAILGSLLAGTVATWVCGASPGKLLLGMRVVDLEGRRPGLWACLIRELAYYVDGLFFGIPAYRAMADSPIAQRLGDRWAGTAVVHRRSLQGRAAASGLRLFLGLAAGFLVYAAVAAAVLVLAVK